MNRDWREDFTGVLLDFQEFITGKWGDEKKIAEYLLNIAVRLGGAERGILKKRKGSTDVLLARYCPDGLSSGPEHLTEEIISYLNREHNLSINPELGNTYGILPEPVKLDNYKLLLSNYMVIKPLVSHNESLEMTLLNLSSSCCSHNFLRAMEALLNILEREEYILSLNIRLEKKEEEIARIADSKTQFLGSLSHEVRSPLNGIVCMGSLLRETDLDEDQLDLLNIIQFSADNITRIIQDLVDLTMLSSGKIVLKNETFSLSTFSNNLVKNIKEEASAKGLNLNVFIEKDLDLFHGDQVRLGQILTNLLQNGIRYTQEGEIFLDIRSSRGGVEFVVSDTGVGIPQDKQDIIFEEFVQLKKISQRRGEYKGVGLGLAIVKDLVTMMGGTVSVRSQEGKGSSFKVFLPQLKNEDFTPNEEAMDTLSSPQELRFLVVDDDEINRLYLQTILKRQGAIIDEAENGLIAVELAGKNSYDMILMDISMPVMNGLDATGNIRQNNMTIPILAVTANAFKEDFSRILEAGLDDIILKPVNENQLLEKVSTWLDRRKVNHEHKD
jgi:signal transduction histidine kinase/CheY-like chemotaxis protein